MRSPLLLKPSALSALHPNAHSGQPLVIAFADSLQLRQSAVLDGIRGELRGLGAALFLVARGQVFWFQPDDELDLYGSSTEVDSSAVGELRLNCGLSQRANQHELSLIVVAGDGTVVTRHTLPAADELAALAEGLARAGRDVIAPGGPLTLSRRDVVLMSLVSAFALLAFDGCRGRPSAPVAPPVAPPTVNTRTITLNVNGQPRALEVEPRVSLLDALRERLGLTGSKKGCDHGQCGACTVLVGGQRVNACLTLAVMVGDAPVTTIEGLARGETLHPLQAAFAEEDALQCGYCTPGQIMSALGLVRENRAHTDAEVREQMSGNLCRCGAYPNIIAAIQRARASVALG